MQRNVIIHGHFYQPPRFNPWTGRMKREATAFPANNWNERIYYECYKPNTEAEVHIDGREEFVNNYEHISFNIGPTLASWMIKAHVATYMKILEADKNTSNAIALPLNHTILPLDSDLNLKAQISWGIQEFSIRFGRKPAAIWLPECAVSIRVAEELVKNRMKYMILTSGQALEVKRIGGSQWYDVSKGNIDVRRPYRLFTPSGHIDVFFSDHSLAADLAFNRLLDNPPALADRIEKLFGRKESEDLLVAIATDGETFGHHHKGSEKGLARLLKYELPSRGIKVTNFENCLKETPVTWEVRIKENSSWSCFHGIERWRSACGCGLEEGSNLEWRAPLRESITWLGGRVLNLLYERAGGYFVHGIEEGIKAYGSVLTNPTGLEKFKEEEIVENERSNPIVDSIIEMIYYSFYSFTSCGWFFGRLDRPEPVQVLSFALRSMDILKDIWGVDLEEEFFGILKRHPDAEFVWNNKVKPSRVRPEAMAKEFYQIYRYSGISKYTYGSWYLAVEKRDGEVYIEMENRRTRQTLSFPASSL